MPFKMKGTAMCEKVNTGKGTTMQLKKEFGGAMEMKSPMDMGHSPKKMKSPMDKALVGDQDKLNEGLKKAIEASPGKMKTPMELEKEDSAMDMSHAKMKSPMDEAHAAMEMESAMKLKSAMDLAKDGPMNLMEESPKKLTQDAAMKMAAAMKKFYNS